MSFVTYGDGGVAGEVHEGVLEHAAVARGEDEAVTVEPLVVLGVVGHRLAVEDVAHGRASHGKTGVTGVGLVDGIDREEANGVHAVLDGVGGDVSRRGDSGTDRLHSAGGDAGGNLLGGNLVHLLAGELGVERGHGGGGHSGGHLNRLQVIKAEVEGAEEVP